MPRCRVSLIRYRKASAGCAIARPERVVEPVTAMISRVLAQCARNVSGPRPCRGHRPEITFLILIRAVRNPTPVGQLCPYTRSISVICAPARPATSATAHTTAHCSRSACRTWPAGRPVVLQPPSSGPRPQPARHAPPGRHLCLLRLGLTVRPVLWRTARFPRASDLPQIPHSCTWSQKGAPMSPRRSTLIAARGCSNLPGPPGEFAERGHGGVQSSSGRPDDQQGRALGEFPWRARRRRCGARGRSRTAVQADRLLLDLGQGKRTPAARASPTSPVISATPSVNAKMRSHWRRLSSATSSSSVNRRTRPPTRTRRRARRSRAWVAGPAR
jgi:hypothetical protein